MTEKVIQIILPLIGVVIGGLIPMLSNRQTNRQTIKRRVLEEQLLVYKEISKVIISTKLIYEENLAGIASAKLLLDTEKKISEKEFCIKFDKHFLELQKSHEKFYELFNFAYLIDEKVYISIKLLYESMSKSLNPNHFLTNKNFVSLISDFENVLGIMSSAIGINNKVKPISIPNPNKLINNAF